VKRRDFPPLLCAIVLGEIPWRRFVSPYIVSSPSLKRMSEVFILFYVICFLFYFYIRYSLLKYKKPDGELAMA